MSAPTKAPAEQATQPLAVPLPPAGCRSAESGVWLVPLTVLAAIASGAVIRVYLDTDGRFHIAVIGLVVLLAVAGGALLYSRVIDR